MSSVQHVFLYLSFTGDSHQESMEMRTGDLGPTVCYYHILPLSSGLYMHKCVYIYIYIYNIIYMILKIFKKKMVVCKKNAVVSCLGRKVFSGFIGSWISTCLSKKHQGQLRNFTQNKCQNWDMALAQYLAWPLRCATFFFVEQHLKSLHKGNLSFLLENDPYTLGLTKLCWQRRPTRYFLIRTIYCKNYKRSCNSSQQTETVESSRILKYTIMKNFKHGYMT